MSRYISAADTAKLIRKQLKAKFAGVKFSVRTDSYAGGASIDVEWTDGPTARLVDAVVKPFAGGGFDGMIDMAYSVEAFLLADGSACFAQTTGTEGSGGTYLRGKAFKPTPDAERVHFGANYVFTKRNVSVRLLESALTSFRHRFGNEAADLVAITTSSYDGFGRWNVGYSDDLRWIEAKFSEIVARRMIAA